MNAKELEAYILSKEYAAKHVIGEWKYIRYTVYCSLFAAIEQNSRAVVLTVYGKFEHYEKTYKGIVIPSIQNDPMHFTDVLLEKDLPDCVIKSMIDFSHREVLRKVLLPRPHIKRYENVPYCGIAPLCGDDILVAIKAKPPLTRQKVDAAMAESEKIDYSIYGISGKSADSDAGEVVPHGIYDKVPYRAVHDEEKLVEILKQLKLYSDD